MGLDLAQYRSTIGCFAGRAIKEGPRSRRKRGRESAKEMIMEAEARSRLRKESTFFWMEMLKISLSFSISILVLDFGKPSYSTNLSPGLASAPLSGDFSVVQKLFLALEDVARMLLALAGLETHPGPSYRVYLIHEPIVPDQSPY